MVFLLDTATHLQHNFDDVPLDAKPCESAKLEKWYYYDDNHKLIEVHLYVVYLNSEKDFIKFRKEVGYPIMLDTTYHKYYSEYDVCREWGTDNRIVIMDVEGDINSWEL